MPKTKQGQLTARFGANLGRILRNRGATTYRAMAELLGTTASDAHKMVNSGHSPTLDKIEDTAAKLGVEVDELLAPIDIAAAAG